MATVIIPELSKKNKYYIPKHRYYELKHFCLQYGDWLDRIHELENSIALPDLSEITRPKTKVTPYLDSTYYLAYEAISLKEKIGKVDQAINELEPWIRKYIFIAVTQGKAFPYLKTVLEIPCEKDTYYERYRRFFWTLNKQLS